MGTLVDIHGNQYHMETWHAEARTARKNAQLEEATFACELVQMRQVMIDESGEIATSPIDMGSYLYVPQDDGTWRVTYVVTDQQTEK